MLHLVRDVDTARLLLAHGADNDAPDSNAATPLQFTVEHDALQHTAELLINNGASVTSTNSQQQT
jgi:ankyrin repeat protein